MEDAPEWVTLALAYAALVFTAATALVKFMQAIIPRLDALSKRTEWEGDDRAVSWLKRATATTADVLDVIQKIMPRIATGSSARSGR